MTLIGTLNSNFRARTQSFASGVPGALAECDVIECLGDITFCWLQELALTEADINIIKQSILVYLLSPTP